MDKSHQKLKRIDFERVASVLTLKGLQAKGILRLPTSIFVVVCFFGAEDRTLGLALARLLLS